LDYVISKTIAYAYVYQYFTNMHRVPLNTVNPFGDWFVHWSSMKTHYCQNHKKHTKKIDKQANRKPALVAIFK